MIIVVSLISVFFISWGGSFSTYREHRTSRKETCTLLSISDYIRNGTISRDSEPVIVAENILRENLSPFLKNLRHQGTTISVEVVVRENSIVYSSKTDLEESTRSVSLPIIYENSVGRDPANLIVQMEV